MISGPIGTRVTVRDLFGNVPARRKFLRQTTTESAYIQRIVTAYASAYPSVQFALTTDGRRTIATDGSGSLQAAAVGAFGIDVGRTLIELGELDSVAAVPGVSVSGWVVAPEITRSHRQDMHFFVNGCWI